MQIIVTVEAERCKGCALCTAVCPKGILKMDPAHSNKKGYHPVALQNAEACIGCASCARICPDSAITVKKSEVEL